ncbi:glycoside hydrolase family 18 [Dysgonomonas sp. 25]|uniref:glycoside hydrolase family 18 n=1 Tax=Dysgonomonas sp. 25 TaxID=2302933 RepID=UPI0013D23000|nr:glycoside hydrolase family 18 [Dysgonomonas sp. 25]NDV69908.1 hypothetical protein [Dysgonomonas sp. 25]
MKNIYMNKILLFLLSLMAGGLMLTSCSDWTDDESVDINEPGIEIQNPTLYAKYLENLRKYKESDHKFIYAWHDNSEKLPFNRSHHLTDLPDSLDAVVLMHPDGLADWEQQEISSIRQEKSIRTLLSIDFDAIKLAHDQLSFEWGQGNPEVQDPGSFSSFLADSLSHKLSLVKKYNYDGIVICYNGKNTMHMEADEKQTYLNNENSFFNFITAWMNLNPTKTVTYQGYPQYLTDKTLFNSFKHIIVPSVNLTNANALAYTVSMASVAGVPTDRFIVIAQTPSFDSGDIKTGYWVDGSIAITSTASWAAGTYSDYTIAGFGIYNINNDYFNVKRVYTYSREAIDTLNPSF